MGYDRHARMVNIRKCYQCGQKFLMRCDVPMYGWSLTTKNKTKIFCSYHCMREYEKPRIRKEKETALRQLQGRFK